MTITLSACLDEAGHDADHDHVVVAGCIALDGDWPTINGKWERMLRLYRLPYFHAKDFNTKKGLYKGWSPLKRGRFLKAVKKIVDESPFMFIAIAVDKKLHKQLKGELRGIKGFSADSDYGFCFRTFRYFACQKVHQRNPAAQLKFIVEDGPFSSGASVIYHDVLAAGSGTYKPARYTSVMGGFASAPKGSLRGLEIADYLADRAIKDLDTGTFATKGRAEQISMIAGEAFLRHWAEGVKKEKQRRATHAANRRAS